MHLPPLLVPDKGVVIYYIEGWVGNTYELEVLLERNTAIRDRSLFMVARGGEVWFPIPQDIFKI